MRVTSSFLAASILSCSAFNASADLQLWEQQLVDGEDILVELPAPLSKDAADELLIPEPVLWKWRGVAVFSDDNDTILPYSLEQQQTDGSKTKTHKHQDRVKDTDAWIAVNVDTGYEYEIELPKNLGKSFRQIAQREGLGAGFSGMLPELQETAQPNATEKGWSNGVDTRTRRFNNTSYPYRAMGQMGSGIGGGCSGTLIGPRHILTAAHCLWNSDNDSWYTKSQTRFRPGREGTCNNASCEPYGEFTARWYFTPVEFRQVDNNWPYDYGIMVVYGRPGNTTGWLGYVATSQSTIRDYCDKVPFGPGYLGGTCFNRGYPICNLAESPDNCQPGWAYQDVNPCEIGGFYNTASDGWRSRFSVNCDMGPGHSGSALFTRSWNGNGTVVFGVASTQSCGTCGSNTEFPNRFRRVTPHVLNWISYFRQLYP